MRRVLAAGGVASTEPVLTTGDGKFVIKDLEKGNYTLIADGPRGTSHGEKKGVKTGDTLTNVKDDGPAAQAGVNVGDKIAAVEGQPLKRFGAALAQKVLSSGSPGVGDTITITLERGPTATLTAIKW